MRVTAVFHGILSEWVGTKKAVFHMEEGALFADLLLEIHRAYRENMPDQLWNEAESTFAKPVLALNDQRQIQSVHAPLRDGQDIAFYLMLAGG